VNLVTGEHVPLWADQAFLRDVQYRDDANLAARLAAPLAALACGDATALPVRTGAADVALGMYMLYHVPEPERAVAELRRIARPGGRVVVALNGAGHLLELRQLIRAGFAGSGYQADLVSFDRITLDQGPELLGRQFGSVVRHDLRGQLRIPGPEPVLNYVRSMSGLRPGPDGERVARAIAARLEFAPGGRLAVTTHAGWLVCS